MKNKIPFSIIPFKKLKPLSNMFYKFSRKIVPNFPSLKLDIEQAKIDATAEQYMNMCIFSTITVFIPLLIILIITSLIFGVENFILVGFSVSLLITAFIFLQQILYPKLQARKKIRGIEVNLLPALQSMLVQLNSGIPLFDIIVNISRENYGGVSEEFKRAIKEINAGRPQVEVLEEIATKNPSLFFRRGLWQLVNGMKAGADISSVIKEIIHALSETQLIQIQNYGGQLNPLAMFFMLIAVILPALGTTFFIIISTFLNIAELTTKLIFWGLYGLIVFLQIMFLGLIKSRRPTLLG